MNDNSDVHSEDEISNLSDSDDESFPSKHFENDPLNSILYPGCPLSRLESAVSILSFILRFQLPKSAVSALLSLINLHCPVPNNNIKTYHQLTSIFKEPSITLQRHYYCLKCFGNLNNEGICSNCSENDDSEKDYFITSPIVPQVQKLFQRPGFLGKLNRINREAVRTCVSDIYDGKIYRQLMSPGAFFSSSFGLSFMWYTDGVQVFKSSKFSFWPFFLVINELPYKDRFKIQNLIFGGMWFGYHKPRPEMFLRKIYEDLAQIYNGIEIIIENIPVVLRGIVCCGTCDLPANALFLNMTQYNGKFGCKKCKQKGQKCEGKWVYQYEKDLSLRTDEETKKHQVEADESGVRVCGVKGSSVIGNIVFKPIQSTAIDFMHYLSGIVKLLLSLHFDVKYANEKFSLYRFLPSVDKRLKEIKLPYFVQRTPRTISDHLPYWKHSELKKWFFDLSLPIYEDIMEPIYFENYKLLHIGICLISKNSISIEDRRSAEIALDIFTLTFEILYGKENMTMNVHNSRHLVDSVSDTGPTWATSCLPLEDINGRLTELIRSSNSPQLQIFDRLGLFISVQAIVEEELNKNSKCFQFCHNMFSPNKKIRIHKESETFSSIGRIFKFDPPDWVMDILNEKQIVRAESQYLSFHKLLKDGIKYYCRSYTKPKKTISYCCKYLVNENFSYFLIDSFLKIQNCSCLNFCRCDAYYFAIGDKCLCHNPFFVPSLGISTSGLTRVDSTIQSIIPISSIVDICYYIQFEDKAYISERINFFESE